MFGDGNGTFENATKLYTSYYTLPFKAIIADLNNDSALDVTVLYYGSFSLGVFLGNNDGTFKTEITFPPEDYSGIKTIVMSDFNNDNYLDAVVTGCESWQNQDRYIGVLFGNGDGTFQPLIKFSNENNECFHWSLIVDLNKDSQLDVILKGSTANGLHVLYGNGDGTFQSFTFISIESPVTLGSVALGDLNNDGRLDIVVTFNGNYLIGILIAIEDGKFDKLNTFSTGILVDPLDVALADFNSDGLLDLVVTYSFFDSVSVFFGIGTGTFRLPIQFSIGSDNSLDLIVVIDINNDTQLDIVGIGYSRNRVVALLNRCNCCISGQTDTL